MYNVNTSGLLPVPIQGDATGATPRTPEILNSLIAMTNPFDAMRHGQGPRVASSPPSDTTSTSSSSASSNSPPSVQHTCSQLIKEGLKLTIQTKRRNNPTSSLTDEPLNKSTSRSDELTPEDEERRRRRRERNKIAATKCRLKKRERTVNLVQESEILENQNQDLKSQIQDLEKERDRLMDMLSVHGPSCSKQAGYNGVGSPTSSGTSVSSYQECYTQCTSASSSPAAYSGYQPAYCKVEATCELAYRHKADASSNYQKMETTEVMSGQGGYGRPSSGGGSSVMLTYHNFEQQGVVSFCQRQVESEAYLRNEAVYADGYGSRGSPSRIQHHYPRPATLGLLRNPAAPGYEANNNLLDSPNVAPTNYHHFDEDAENFTAAAGFPSGSCVT